MPPAGTEAGENLQLPLRGASYPVLLRWTAGLAMAALLPAAAVSDVWHQLPSDMLLAVCLVAAITLWQWAEVMASVTELDTTGVQQGLFRSNRIEWADVTQARLIAWRSQERWFGSRLVLQVRGRGRRVVRLGTTELRQAADAVLQAGNVAQAAGTSRSSPPM